MKYKALMLDIDGTVSPNQSDGIPSPKVTEAIAKISSNIHVSLVTGRPLNIAKPIIDHLKLSGPCIVTDGTQIFDPISKEFVFEVPMKSHAVQDAYELLRQYDVQIFVNDGEKEYEYTGGPFPKKVLILFVPSIPKQTADVLIKPLQKLSSINAYKGLDWVPGREYIVISDINGSKLHGIVEVAKILGIQTHEMIGVGDGYNDFPLLMACGLKIAMGNAVPELKAIADFIAPSVEEDGVATVIDKFILNNHV